METKPAIQSKAYWGIFLMIVSYVAPAIGALITNTAPQIAQFIEALTPDLIDPYVRPAIFAIGAALAKYGRDKAERPISGVFKKKAD